MTFVSKGNIVMLTLDRQIDRRILLEADSLEEDGWSVSIISMPCEEHEEANDPRVIRLQNRAAANSSVGKSQKGSLMLGVYNFARKLLSSNQKWVQAIRSLIRVYIFDSVGFYSKLYLSELSDKKFDVIVAHDLPMLPIAAIAAKQKKAKLVYDSHELFVEQNLPKYEIKGWERIEARNIKLCDAVITINQSIADELAKRYQLKGVLIVQNAERVREVDSHPVPKLFHEKFNLADDAKIVLLQGGLFSDRNLEVLVRAMALLRDRNIHLVFLGNGNGVPILKELAVNHQLNETVHFMPAVPQDDLQKFTMSADIGVIPYLPDCLNNYYCTPNKMFEFVAAGLPIVASDLPEIRKIVEGNRVGLVADSSSEEIIAGAIRKILSSDETFLEYKCRVLALRKTLNWQNEGKKIVRLFNDLKSNPAIEA